MDFQSPGKDPDTSVKIYLSIQKQAKGKRSQEGSVGLEEEFVHSYSKLVKGSNWVVEVIRRQNKMIATNHGSKKQIATAS